MTRTYDEWLQLAVITGRRHGIGSREWNELGREAAVDLDHRVWVLKYEASQKVAA